MKSTIHLCLAIFIALPLTSAAQEWAIETLRSDIFGAQTACADFDNDNDPDILVQSGDTVFWYENLRPGWAPHVIEVAFYNSFFSWLGVLDIDSDGDMDVLKAPFTTTNADTLTWNENQGNGTAWVKHNIVKLEAGIAWLTSSYGDLDKDGDVDLVIPQYDYWSVQSPASLFWLENENNSGIWTKHTLRSGNHWYSSVADIDGDNDLDIISTASGVVWLENVLPDTSWSLHQVSTGDFYSNYIGVVADFNGDNKPDIVSQPADSNAGLTGFYINPDWQRLDITLYKNQYIMTGDVDGDGDKDIPYGGTGGVPRTFGWAENQNNGADWVSHDITDSTDLQIIPTGVADIDGDGDHDIVALTFNYTTGFGSAFWAANPKISVGVSDQHAIVQQPSLSIAPNPFSSATIIQYQLYEPGEVCLSVYNLLGQRVRTLNYGREDTGTHSLTWDGRTENGEQAPKGVYWVRLETENGSVSGTVIVN